MRIDDILTAKGFKGWSVNADDYASLVWDDAQAGRSKPTAEEIQSWAESAQVVFDALAEIARLESEITPQIIRKAILGTDNGWLANQESLIDTQRAKLNN